MIIDKILSFFIDNFPTLNEILIGGPVGLLWAFLCLFIAGYLKSKKGFRTGYSRKIFHFSIFGSVALIQWQWGTSIVCLFGGMTTIVVFYAIHRGSGNILYEAMAREKDSPHRTHYIVVPYFATLIGGLVTNIIFGPIAVIGYLVTGLGDAVGEPVGTKFGKHKYRTPSLTSVKSERSLEGSTAVWLMSFLAIIAGIALSPELSFSTMYFFTVPALSIICALTEALTPHGWDNTTMQVVPVWIAHFLL
jgi:phytol kinase